MSSYYAAVLAAALTYHISALSAESREQLRAVLINVLKAGS